MNIQKRSLPVFILLNCLTLGIYGAIQCSRIGNEVNALCKQDGEQPGMSYFGALFIRAIPAFFGVVIGLITGIVSSSFVFNALPFMNNSMVSGYYNQLGSVKIGIIFLCILIYVVIFSLIGNIASGLYLKYWWFKQTTRLQLNANRYNMVVRESGTDHFVFRTATELPLLPASIALKTASLFIPTLICFLLAFASPIFAIVLYTVFIIAFCVFGAEISAGASFSMSRVIKTMNRYASVYRNGVKPFNPMAYDYYPCADSLYPASLPKILDCSFMTPPVIIEKPVGNGDTRGDSDSRKDRFDFDPDPKTDKLVGKIVGLKGSCAGYNFDLNPGEEIVIGKDAKVSNVVIDPVYKEISRKHVSVLYDASNDIYRVTDYSSNGTWADGQKLTRNEITNLRRGTVLKLANDKNTFRLS